MGYISGVYDAYSNTLIKAFPAIGVNADHRLYRRSGTYSVIGLDGGVDPQGFNAHPAAPRDVSFSFREYFKNGSWTAFKHTSFDAARDSLMAALGNGVAVKLEYTTDSKTKRYVIAKAKDWPHTVSLDQDFFADFKVTMEMYDPFWSDLYPKNVTRWGTFNWGDGVTVWGAIPIALGSANVNFTADLTGATAFDLPSIQVDGPFGGLGGWMLFNNSVTITTDSGNVPISVGMLDPLLSGESVRINPASLEVTKVTAAGSTNVFDRMVWPKQQRYMFLIDPHTKDNNPINSLTLSCVGGSSTFGGKILFVYTLRYW